MIIIDDPVKPIEVHSEGERRKNNRWLTETLVPRLNDKATGAIVIAMQRLHEDDLIGHAVTRAQFEELAIAAIAQRDEEYVIRTPYGQWRHRRQEGDALDPVREPLSVLDDLRLTMPPDAFAAQYLQTPTTPGGGIIKLEWFQRFDLGTFSGADVILQSWDTANKADELADYSVCTTWAKKDGRAYLLHVLREKLEYPQLRERVRLHAAFWRAQTVLIEESASGIQLVQDLRNDNMPGITPRKAPNKDKVMRMRAQTAQIASGMVYLPDRAPWLEALEYEFMMFPNGTYDDQVDSTSQAIDWLFFGTGPEAFLFDTYAQRARQKPVTNGMIRIAGPAGSFITIRGRAFNVNPGQVVELWPDEYNPVLRDLGYRVVDDQES